MRGHWYLSLFSSIFYLRLRSDTLTQIPPQLGLESKRARALVEGGRVGMKSVGHAPYVCKFKCDPPALCLESGEILQREDPVYLGC